jgi:Kef-type K+ transport system membrane component KefB
VANFARHHQRPFHEIKGIEWPFLILFFLLSGARLEIEALAQVGVLGAGYIALRVVGRIVGTYLGGRLVGVEPGLRRWMGVALMPQAGVAMGMALLAVQTFPEYEDVILPVILGSTVIFELAGPVATRWALIRVGDGKPERS